MTNIANMGSYNNNDLLNNTREPTEELNSIVNMISPKGVVNDQSIELPENLHTFNFDEHKPARKKS